MDSARGRAVAAAPRATLSIGRRSVGTTLAASPLHRRDAPV